MSSLENSSFSVLYEYGRKSINYFTFVIKVPLLPQMYVLLTTSHTTQIVPVAASISLVYRGHRDMVAATGMIYVLV